MGTQRVSMKDVAEKLDTLIALMAANAAQQPAVTTVTEPEPAKAGTVKLDKAYLNKMVPKWDQLANKTGEQFIGYAYRKSNGKTGLWGCKASELAKVSKQERYIGNVHISDPS